MKLSAELSRSSELRRNRSARAELSADQLGPLAWAERSLGAEGFTPPETTARAEGSLSTGVPASLEMEPLSTAGELF